MKFGKMAKKAFTIFYTVISLLSSNQKNNQNLSISLLSFTYDKCLNLNTIVKGENFYQ